MEKRRSIEVSGVKHMNPIPSASRKGPFVVSGAISGADPETGTVPADLDAQCRNMFVQCAAHHGGGRRRPGRHRQDECLDRRPEIARGDEPLLGPDVPDPHSRPARHTVTQADFTPPMQIQCDLLAVLGEE